jgi:hypothetical protein
MSSTHAQDVLHSGETHTARHLHPGGSSHHQLRRCSPGQRPGCARGSPVAWPAPARLGHQMPRRAERRSRTAGWRRGASCVGSGAPARGRSRLNTPGGPLIVASLFVGVVVAKCPCFQPKSKNSGPRDDHQRRNEQQRRRLAETAGHGAHPLTSQLPLRVTSVIVFLFGHGGT